MRNVLRACFAIVGIACLAGAIWLFVRRLSLLVQGISRIGRVEAFEVRADDGSFFYLPVVSFTDESGEARRFTAVAGSNREPRVGSVVPVRYLRTDPTTAFIVSLLHMWAAPLGLAVLAAGAVLRS